MFLEAILRCMGVKAMGRGLIALYGLFAQLVDIHRAAGAEDALNHAGKDGGQYRLPAGEGRDGEHPYQGENHANSAKGGGD